MENLIKRVHDYIVDSARRGIGCRTTETGQIAQSLGLGAIMRDHVALAVLQLVDEGKLKCVSETLRRSHCWLVEPTWEDLPVRGFIHVPRAECEIFDLYPEPGKQIVTDDGYVLSVRSSMYVDWGLEIRVRCKEVFYNPHCLSNDSYGCRWTDDDGNDLDEGIPWTDKEWREHLRAEADALIECFVGDETLDPPR